MLAVPPSWTIVKTPSLRVVRVVVSSRVTPPRPRALPSWMMTPPWPCAPWRLSCPCCWNSRTTLTWRPVWDSAGVARGGVPGQLRDPELAVADVELLLLEDALDGPRPGPVGALPHVLQLVTRPSIHAEVEEGEVRPRVDRVVEDVHALVGADAGGADIGRRVDAHGEGFVVGPHVGVHVHSQIGEEPVHDGRVPVLILDDLRDDAFLLDARRLHDPRHVARAAGELGGGLHGHEVYQALPVLLRHLLGGLYALAAVDPGEQLHFRDALAHARLPSTTRTAQ